MLPSTAASSSGHWNMRVARLAAPHRAVAASATQVGSRRGALDQRHALAGARGSGAASGPSPAGGVEQLGHEVEAGADLGDADETRLWTSPSMRTGKTNSNSSIGA